MTKISLKVFAGNSKQSTMDRYGTDAIQQKVGFVSFQKKHYGGSKQPYIEQFITASAHMMNSVHIFKNQKEEKDSHGNG